MITIHQKTYLEEVKKKFSYPKEMIVYQCVYLKKEIKMHTVDDITIMALHVEHIEQVQQIYSMADTTDTEYIEDCLHHNLFFGAYDKEKLVGIIGRHAEKSIGFLEVIPSYQGRGIAKYLETYLIDQILKIGEIPYAQIKVENGSSIALHKSLGFIFDEQEIL